MKPIKPLTPAEQEKLRLMLVERRARLQDRYGPDYQEALINLIDGLRDYIKADTTIADELLQEGAITRKVYDQGMIQVRQMMMVLRTLEQWDMDSTLCGLIKEKAK